MSGHLAPEEISGWLTGEQSADGREHMARCAECRSKVARSEAALRQFRSSVRDWSQEQSVPVWYPRETVRYGRPGRWLLAAAMLLVLVTVPLYQSARERRRAREQAEADAVLLERIDRAVSRTVPRPMEPLVQLVEWNSAEAKGNEKQ